MKKEDYDKKEPNRKVGISNTTLNNSSINNITIDGSDSDADVGIFDTEIKGTHLSDLNIKATTSIPNPKEIKQKPITPIIVKVGIPLLIAIVAGLVTLAVEYKWFK